MTDYTITDTGSAFDADNAADAPTSADVLPYTRDSFLAWLNQAQRGEKITYFVGDLARTRDQLDGKHALALLADEAMKQSDQRRVWLTQKRLGRHLYEYQATRTRRPA
jgi:hypothetical protein